MQCGSVWECRAAPMLREARTMFLQQQQHPTNYGWKGKREPNPIQLLPMLNKALISSCVREAVLLETSASLMEKGEVLSLSTFLITLRQERLYPNPAEKQECYRQCFKYLMFTQHSEYKWQFKEKGTPISVSSLGSFHVCFSAWLTPVHTDGEWQQGCVPCAPKTRVLLHCTGPSLPEKLGKNQWFQLLYSHKLYFTASSVSTPAPHVPTADRQSCSRFSAGCSF